MKKISILFAAAVMAATASAQTVTESKTFDNMYVGVNTGVSTASHLYLASQLRATFTSRKLALSRASCTRQALP